MRAFLASTWVLLLVGCAAGSEAPDLGTGPEVGSGTPAASAPAPHNRAPGIGDTVDAPVTGPVTTFAATCRSDAFCEDFESADPASRWTSELVTTGGAIAIATPSASAGARSLHLEAAPGARAFLLKENGVASGAWAGAVAFTMKVDTAPAERLAGPELVVGDARVLVSYAHDALVVEQRLGDTVVAATVVGTPSIGAWQRVVIGVEVNPNAQAPYGRLEVSIDGGDLQPMGLEVPLLGATRELHAGITAADVASLTASIDDVMFFVP